MTLFGFPGPLGVFLQMAQLDPTTRNQVLLVDAEVETLPFGLLASYRVRNDTPRTGSWVVLLNAQSFQYGFQRTRTGQVLNLAPGETSQPQQLDITGLPRDAYDVELTLEERPGGARVSTIAKTVEVGGPVQAVRVRREESAFYFGSAEFADGPSVPAGTVLTARVGGTQSGSIILRSPGTFGIGTDPLLVRNAQANPGDTVTFFVNGFQATETASYNPDGIPRRLTLTIVR